ncbi:hypothetical protein GLOIN_2v1773466 [Rhizophagus irregularis DAOM 181602=DAOM 197198]|nr:hypothetical protein GLOIN_2v1773466 [Rhizophagus irregularis DAOM 181602=DAOM 197198]
MSEKIDLSDIEELDINYIELDPEYQVESDSNTIESDKDTDISDEEEDSIAIFSRKTHVQEVHYATVPIEYPKTSEYGVATVYNITGWKNPRDCWKNIQYSLGGGGQSSIKNCPFFGNISIKKEERNCMGIKHCEFINPEIINMSHNEVDFDSEFWQEISKNKHVETKKSKTYALYLGSMESKCKFKQNGISCSGKPKLINLKNYQTSTSNYIIGCDKYKLNDKYHRYIKVDPATYDIPLLRDLLNGNVEERELLKYCTTISSRSSKQKLCEKTHINSDGHIVRGNIKERTCRVQFTLLTPYDLNQCPCIVIICKGIHNHPPPPPERIPDGIKDDLQDIIKNAIEDDNSVTAGSITSDIYSNELVIFVCMLKDQAKLIHQLGSIQIDLTFKRVKGNINEFEINSYNTEHKLILSYARVYTNVTTAEGYQQLFTDLFNVIKDLTGQAVKFRHIDGNGIGCIIGDLDPAQAKGLGLFLQSKDTHKDWETHLQYIFKSCVVHFERNARAKKFSSETLNLILNIPTAPSIGELEKIFYTLEQLEESKIKEWIRYYRQPYVLASLNLNASKIDPEIWASSANNTNVAEAAHALANREGKHLKLLTAIIRGRKVDQKAVKIMETENKFGVPYSRRDNGEVKKFLRQLHIKPILVDSTNIKAESSQPKRKGQFASTRNSKQRKITENNTENIDFDIEERKIALKERELQICVQEAAARKALAEAEAMELINLEKKKSLGLL